ncbi:hypothetical protein MKX03_003524, partial [Papaver bracteatum]
MASPVRRSPRIRAQLSMELDNERQKQRDIRLHKRRISEKEKRAAMAEGERQELLQKRRHANLMRKTRDRFANKDGLEASTSSANEQFALRTGVGERDNYGKENINSQGNAVVSGRCIPHRSPRISEQVQCLQLVDTEKERGNKRCNKPVDSDTVISGSTKFFPRRSPRLLEQFQRRESEKERGKRPCNESVDSDDESAKKKCRLETRRAADKQIRNSMSQNEREQILETRRAAYQMRRQRVSDATNEDRGAGTSCTLIERAKKRQSEIDEELTTTENKRCKKCRHESNPEQIDIRLQERRVLDKEKISSMSENELQRIHANTTRLGTKNRDDQEAQTSTDRNEAPIINLCSSPRLIEQAQHQESSNPQNQNSNINCSGT